ncbi:MAG: alpha/beta fold hydrolase [Planctomycetes bacterium]|nr:alpha/beta fold hydrolase [Planctomycetota bacterium]
MLWFLASLIALTLVLCALDAGYAAWIASGISAFESGLNRDGQGVVQGKQAFQRPGGKAACLLLHGYRGSPQVFRELADRLEAGGVTVNAILLPGHGRRLRDLEAVRWPNWTAAVESAYLHLREQHDKVFIVGFSLGGLLAFHLASRQSASGVVAISPFFRVHPQIAGGKLARARHHLARLALFTRYVRLHHLPDIRDEDALRRTPVNPFYPLRTTRSLIEFADQAFPTVQRAQCPLLILQSRTDRVVDVSRVEAFHAGARSADKELAWFDDSGHELLLDREKERVMQRVVEFVLRRS